jgi:hypothetical protein
MSKTVLANVDGWTPCIDSIAQELGVMASVVFGRVWRYCQLDDGVCLASIDRIASDLKLSYNTVRTHINTLVEHGYLEDKTPHLRNHPHTYADTGKAGITITVSATPQNMRSHSSNSEEHAHQNLAMKKVIKKEKKEGLSSVVAIPEVLDTPDFLKVWEEWKAYRKELRKPVTPTTARRQLEHLAECGPAAAAAMILQSIEHGWQGLFPLKDQPRTPPTQSNGTITANDDGSFYV